jgi:hypothetical protein
MSFLKIKTFQGGKDCEPRIERPVEGFGQPRYCHSHASELFKPDAFLAGYYRLL